VSGSGRSRRSGNPRPGERRRGPARRGRRGGCGREELLYGLHAVERLLCSGRRRACKVLLVEGTPGPRLRSVIALAEQRGVPVERLSRQELAARVGDAVHQGVAAEAEPLPQPCLPDWLAEVSPRRPLVALALDGVQDPHNLGAILRTAEAAAVAGIILPANRSARLTPAALKAACGAAEVVPLITVVNLARSLEQVREAGLWTVGLDVEAEDSLFHADLPDRLLLVLGGEGTGIRPGVLKRCDFRLRIPLAGAAGSLNVSAAAAVACFEIRRRFPGGVPA